MPTQTINKTKLFLLTLRGVSVLAKFLFTTLFFQFSETGFGEYSLVATTILLLVFLIGMDFYSYANRAVLAPDSNPQKIIFNQFSLYVVLYVLMLPVVYLIFKSIQFNQNYFWLFYLVLITEHLNFEFYRLMFVFKKPLAANINLFLRNGLWVLVASIYLFYQHQIDIQTVLWLWFGGNIAALSFSVALSLSKRQKIDTKHFKLDKKWIIKGISVSLPFILGSLAYKTIEFSDRYLIDYFLGKQAVGVYSFFANMANVLNIVLFTLVVSVLYPSLVESIMQKKHELFEKVYKQFKKETFLYALLVCLFLSILLPVVLLVSASLPIAIL
jgi:O-antigen/teichoic acid export membrane protein